MTNLSKAYAPETVESKWYASWLKNGCFKVNPLSHKDPYSIMIPPPQRHRCPHYGPRSQ